MAQATAEQSAPVEPRPITAPDSFNVCVRGFDTEDHANKCAQLVGLCVRELSRRIDLSGLDGITIASDYNQALLELDRGYSTTYQLTPSKELGIGVAMTPSVLRDGMLKSHIVLEAGIATGLEDETHENFAISFHILAHECAHVEVTQRFEAAFPDFLLRKKYDNARDVFRWRTILTSWDEYAATNISAPFGHDPTKWYEETFIRALNETRPRANDCIKKYRVHHDLNRVMDEVYGAYGDLLKFAAYHLGNMAGRSLSLADIPNTQTALDGHWFASYCQRLDDICRRIGDQYGKWPDPQPFEQIGDLAEELIANGGLIVSHLEDGSLYVDIPFTSETMPMASLV